MKFSSRPFQVSENFPPFSAVTVRTTPAAKVLMIQSEFLASVMLTETRYVLGSGPSVGSWYSTFAPCDLSFVSAAGGAASVDTGTINDNNPIQSARHFMTHPD